MPELRDPVIEDALADNLLPGRFDELRAALLHHHDLPDIAGFIIYSSCGWHIVLGSGLGKIEGKGKTLAEAVEKVIQPRNPLSPAEQLLKAVGDDPSMLLLVKRALGQHVSAGVSEL